VLTESGVADLQRLAGNRAAQSLIQRQAKDKGDAGAQPVAEPAPSKPVEAWDGSMKGYLKDNPALYYTLNNFGDQQLEYQLRIKNQGHAMVNLETKYELKYGGEQRAWIAIAATSGKTEQVTNGLPPHSSLHLRLYGQRDMTQPNQVWVDGALEVRRTK
jgi:hypothetical protein